MQAESIRRTQNEKAVSDHSNSVAIGGLGGCTEHIKFAQLPVNHTQFHNIAFNHAGSINNTKHLDLAFNLIGPVNHSGHQHQHDSDHYDDFDYQLKR